VEPAPRLAAAIGLAADALWIKRDDLTGLGGGGNKLRKLRYTGAQARAAGLAALVADGRIKPGDCTVSCTPAGYLACSVIPDSRT
jgi:1-aminocyclopropane-1-carboxylate deaminase/D-cysteine desulfhydrase-like pyridoxal-dependent ACC family enzyme